MNGTIVTPTPHILRDRYDRPLVVPPDGKVPGPHQMHNVRVRDRGHVQRPPLGEADGGPRARLPPRPAPVGVRAS